MRKILILLAAAACLAAGGPAQAGVSLGASCTDGIVTCGVSIFNADYDWQGVVIQWRYGNVCASPVHLVDMEPLPLPPVWTDDQYTVTFPAPDADEWLEYRAYFIAPDGSLHPAPGAGDPQPFDWAACGDPVLSRGYLTGDTAYVNLEVCPDTCWFLADAGGTYVVVEGLDPEDYEYLLNSGIPVDIRGEPWIDGMPGGTTIWVTAIAPTAGGVCGPPVATAPVTWSTLKSLYRE